MAFAKWNGVIIAESDETVLVEGNHYFPEASVRQELLKPTDHKTTCGWKGVASYKSIEVGGAVNENAVWYYPEPKAEAGQLKGRYAFWKGVEVQGGSSPDQTPEGAACDL